MSRTRLALLVNLCWLAALAAAAGALFILGFTLPGIAIAAFATALGFGLGSWIGAAVEGSHRHKLEVLGQAVGVTHAGEGVILRATNRFAHGRDHVRRAVEASGLAVVEMAEVSTRTEKRLPVPGLLAIARTA